jgi:uncharacterized protein
MAKDFNAMEDSNMSSNSSIHDVSNPARRTILQGSAIAGVGSLLGCAAIASNAGSQINFKAIPPGMGDKLVVADGYTATTIAAWGEPVGIPGSMPAFKIDGSNTAADQAVQVGMHHDGLEYFPINGSSTHGVLAINNEYTDDGLLHVGGFNNMNEEKVKKSQNAHGISICEVMLKDGKWGMVRPSKYARRILMSTPFTISGPAAGHAMMRTAADPAGTTILGTLNNCAGSKTPWGTYLSGEENFMFYFGGGDNVNAHQRCWGMRKDGLYQWEKFDTRFDATKSANESNRFGWVVEVDPMDPTSTPVKRTALGRAAH